MPSDNYDYGKDSSKTTPRQLAINENKNLLTPEKNTNQEKPQVIKKQQQKTQHTKLWSFYLNNEV